MMEAHQRCKHARTDAENNRPRAKDGMNKSKRRAPTPKSKPPAVVVVQKNATRHLASKTKRHHGTRAASDSNSSSEGDSDYDVPLRPIEPCHGRGACLPVGVPIVSASSSVTLCQRALAPYESSAPTAIYPMPLAAVQAAAVSESTGLLGLDCCGTSACPCPQPTAPIYVPSLGAPADTAAAHAQGYDFALGGAQFQLLVGMLDTDSRMELARVTLLPLSSLPAVRACLSDAWLVCIAGLALVQVNGAVRPLTPGTFIYVHAGSMYAVSCAPASDTPAVVLLGFMPAGPMGFYRGAADILSAAATGSGGLSDADVLASITRLADHHGLRAC